MKKLVITGIAVLGLSLGALAQGTVSVDNTGVQVGTSAVFLNTAGNFYTGPINVEVWFKNTAADASVSAINSLSGNATGAYAALPANGWVRESTISLSGTVNGGQFSLGTVTLPDVSPAGSTISLALAGYFGGSSYGAASHGGVLALANIVTGNPGAQPPGTPADLNAPWDLSGASLVLTAVPEPGTFALAGLGAAAMLIFRRRK